MELIWSFHTTTGGVIAMLLASQSTHCAGELAEGLQLLQHRGYGFCSLPLAYRTIS